MRSHYSRYPLSRATLIPDPSMRHLGVVEGTSPPYGYGYGASQFVDSALPGTQYPQTPYPAQMFGRDSLAELHGYQLGSFLDTIQSVIGGVAKAATAVENVARGIAVGSTATQAVVGQASSNAGGLFQPSAADAAARQIDVANALGLNYTPILIGGGLLLLLLIAKK